jgi:hypothetical protein
MEGCGAQSSGSLLGLTPPVPRSTTFNPPPRSAAALVALTRPELTRPGRRELTRGGGPVMVAEAMAGGEWGSEPEDDLADGRVSGGDPGSSGGHGEAEA